MKLFFSFLGGLMHFCPNLSCTISAKLKLEILNLLSICCRSDKVVLFSCTNWYWMFETFYVSETFTQKLDWNCFKFYRNARSRGRRKRRKLQKIYVLLLSSCYMLGDLKRCVYNYHIVCDVQNPNSFYIHHIPTFLHIFSQFESTLPCDILFRIS